ncbi:MAG: YggT family protein [Cyanobacteria bacterium J06648_16]
MLAALIPAFVQGLVVFLNLYFVLLIVRILLSWFPNMDWSNPLLSALSQLTDPYLNLFRSLIPPMGGIDFSAILAILLLQFVTRGVQVAAISLIAATGGYLYM